MDKVINWLKGLNEPGKKVAQVVHRAKKTYSQLYDKYIKPTADKINELRPLAIQVARKDDELNTQGNKQTVFVFDKVTIVDHDAVTKQLEGKEPLGVSKPTGKSPLYTVKLAIDNLDTRIGEVDFSNWERDDFHLTVTKKGTPPKILDPTKDKTEYDQVLNTLKKIAKVSVVYPSLSPNDKVTEVGINKGIRDTVGEGIAYLSPIMGKGMMGVGLEYLRSIIVGNEVEIDGKQNPHLNEKQFVNDLIKLAAEKSKSGDNSILENYYGTLEQSIKNELLIAKEEQKKAESIVKEKTRSLKKTLAMIGVIGVTTFPLLITMGVSAALFAGISYGVMRLFGTQIPLSTTPLVLGATAAYTATKGAYDFQIQSIEDAKHDLAEINDLTKSLEESLEVTKEIKNNAKLATEITSNLEQKNTESLDLSQKNTPDIGVKIICAFIDKPEGLPSCKQLLLSNNKITETGAIDLANTLTGHAKKQFNGINLRKIDLSGNPIGERGVNAIQEMLSKNLTITNFTYDKDYSLKDKDNTTATIPSTLVDKIDKQLLINRYLQGITPLEMSEDRIKTLFPPDGDKQLQDAAVKKVQNNFSFGSTILEHIKVKDETIATQIKNTLTQNDLFSELISKLPTPSITTMGKAVNIDPDRYGKFISTHLSTEQKQQVEAVIKNNVVVLQECNLETRKQLLTAVFTTGKDSGKNIAILANLIENLPKDKKVTPIVTDTLQKAYAHINTETTVEFKKNLENKRLQIAQKTDISAEQKNEILKAFDLALHPELGTGYEDLNFKKYRLQKLITDHPTSQESLNQTFVDFIDLYKTIPEDQTTSVFPGASLNNLLELVRTDVYDGTNVSYTQLKALGDSSPKHLQSLFEFCFKSEPEGDKKAALLTRMITQPSMFETNNEVTAVKSNHANHLYHAFPWPRTLGGKALSFLTARYLPAETGVYSYKELTKHLDKERKKLAKNTNITNTSNTLIKDIDFIRNPETRYESDSPEVKKYMLQKLVTDHPNTPQSLRKTFKDFIEKYENISEDQIASLFNMLNTKKFTKLALADISEGSANSLICTALKSDNLKHSSLLEFCFKDGELKKELDKKILAAITAQNNEEAKNLDRPLQAILQKNLVKQYTCLREPPSSVDLDKLQLNLAANYDLRTFEFPNEISSEIKQQINKITEQNNSFSKLIAELPNTTISTINTALNTDPKRCANFIATQLTEKQRSQLQEYTTKNVMELHKLKLTERKQILGTIFPTKKESEKNIEILANLMEKLPKDINEKVKISDILQKACSHINKQPTGTFQEKLQKKRLQISQLTNIDKEQKTALLTAFDLALHPELGDYNSVEFVKYRLQKLVTDHPLSPEASKEILNELLYVYKTIPENATSTIFDKVDLNELTKLVITDLTANSTNSFICNQAKSKSDTLSDSKHFTLLETCFKNGNLKKELDKQRLGALTKGDTKKAEELDYPLQIMLQKQLLGQYTTDLNKFKTDLKNNLDLRKMELLSGIGEKDKKYVEQVINRNKLLAVTATSATPTEKLKQFLEIYSNISSDEERQSCLKNFKEIPDNAPVLLGLIKDDINKNNFKLLNNLPENQRRELLETCLSNDPQAHGTAALVSKLITLASNQSIKSDYIWRIFSWPGMVSGEYQRWNFTTYIKELNKLKISKPDISTQIDEIIQTGLKEDLISRFGCLSSTSDNKSSFDELKKELENNHDLVGFDPTPKNIEAQNYINFISQRNMLHKCALTNDWGNFIKTYKEIIKSTGYEKCFLDQDKLKILGCIKQDLGSPQKLKCDDLRTLDEKSLTHLLKHCVKIGPSETTTTAEQKAETLSKMLKHEFLFDPQYKDEKLVKDITYILYWSLSTEGDFMGCRKNVPYYSSNEMQQKLEAIKNNLDQGGYSSAPETLQKSLNKTLEEVLPKKPEVVNKI